MATELRYSLPRGHSAEAPLLALLARLALTHGAAEAAAAELRRRRALRGVRRRFKPGEVEPRLVGQTHSLISS